jgi:hypothetical protein
MVTHRLGAVLVSAIAIATACASAPKVPVYGTWKVTSFSAPGVSAQTSVPALSWVGVSASFASNDARVGGDRCSSPKYTARSLSSAEFQQEYKVAPATLGLSSEPIAVYHLECGSDWGGRTSTLIVKSPTSLLTPWDGTFFELVKSPTSMK